MRKLTLAFLMVLLLAFALSACGGGSEEAAESGGDSGAVGDAANGERLFNESIIGSASAPGCITCHSLEPDVVIVGPSQSDVGARAETEGAALGMSAEEYLRQSIVEPDANIAERVYAWT